ncbi:MAG: hypothetical protein GX556_11940 [Fibrobacter sp.]|nr:hypothetical protein [Fibrobacter sp.]
MDRIQADLKIRLKSWRCSQKIVVIESDDWGSIRTASADAYRQLCDHGYRMEHSNYSLDSLETEDDLHALYDVLRSVKDCQGKPASITANMIMANPDFRLIKESHFTEYQYESVLKTLSSKNRNKVKEIWEQGRKDHLFMPQFHGREHVRYWKWLDDLRSSNFEALETFELGMCGVPQNASKSGTSYYSPPYQTDEELGKRNIDIKKVISEGISMFTNIFGEKPESAIAPNYTWTDAVEKIWAENNVRFIQGMKYQYHGTMDCKSSHFLGEKNKYGQIYLVRNAHFEPSEGNADCVNLCLAQISSAFRQNMPAIISSHRVNYMGCIKESNRKKGLEQLELLLRNITSKWPDMCFLTTPELGKLILESKLQ